MHLYSIILNIRLNINISFAQASSFSVYGHKNAGHDMAIVGEPCNADTHAKIPALFISMLCLRLCVHMYCTH